MSRFSMGKMKKSYCTATTFIQTSEGLSGIFNADCNYSVPS